MSLEVGHPLFVVTDPARRGAQIFASELAEAVRSRLAVHTVALGPASGRDGQQLDLTVLGPRRWSTRSLLGLRREIKQASCCVGFGSTTLPALAMTTVRTGVPFIYRSIGELGYWASDLAKRMRVRAALRRADTVVVLWEGARRSVTAFGIPDDRVRVIPRGVSARAFPLATAERRADARALWGLPADSPVVAIVGSLTSEKRVSLAIAAIALAGADVHALVVGDGPERAALERQAAEMAPRRCIFTGWLADTAAAYAAADVVLLTSESEGMPGVLIEAGLSGRPAVTTAVGAAPEVTRDGVTGAVVAVDAAPAEVAAALREVLEADDSLGRQAHEHCRTHYELGPIADSWCELLASTTRSP